MKKYISWVLVWALILQLPGCYSITKIDEINEVELTDFENNDVKIKLFSGKTYRSEAQRHTDNINNSDFIIGKGKKCNSKSMDVYSFEGKIYRTEIDSQLIDGGTLNLWLKDNVHILFNKGDYFIFTPDMKKGVWVLEESGKIFINNDDIKLIEVESLNILTTTAMVIGVSVVVFAIIFGIEISNDFEDAL